MLIKKDEMLIKKDEKLVETNNENNFLKT